MVVSTPGDHCGWWGRTRHRAGSCCLYPQLSRRQPWAGLGGMVPPRVCARSSTRPQHCNHRQGPPDTPSFLWDQPKITRPFLRITLLLFLTKARSCSAVGTKGRAFPAQKPHQDTPEVRLTVGNSCRQAGTCPPCRFLRSSHKTLPHSQSGACLPRPPMAKSRGGGDGGRQMARWQPVPWH